MEPKSGQWGPKGGPKAAQGEGKHLQNQALALKRLGMASWSSKMGGKGSHGEPQRRPKAAKGSQKAAQRPVRRIPKISKINLKIKENIGFVFY